MERQPKSNEVFTAGSAEALERLAGKTERKVGPEAAANQEKLLERARETIEKTETAPKHEAKKGLMESGSSTGISRKLHYRETMVSLQRRLKPASRRFSRLIHHPVVEAASEVAERTVFRPSVTAGAGLTALIVGGAMYGFAWYYGFSLQGSELLILLIIGGISGLLLEVLIRSFKRMTRG
ncbi:MAG TPA: hypothetical protein VNA68_02440 [Candidatus Dormibacteraeota bacterium]|nr:hypothetical protein [Candidatus Dormibacteraeota bacterium]